MAMDDLFSPVEERHIDYILEEEFCVNPDFLKFFILQAQRSTANALSIPNLIEEHGCKAVRSVTTGSGESDVLMTYQSAAALPTAILIEDKIRAGFQPNQPDRYRARGEAGKGSAWSDYWTCFIAHLKYISSPEDFDAVITLQELQAYFAARPDARSQFRARTLEQAIHKYETSGLQRKDESITRFRYRYAAELRHGCRRPNGGTSLHVTPGGAIPGLSAEPRHGPRAFFCDTKRAWPYATHLSYAGCRFVP